MDATVNVRIPYHTASVSKMSKKGWKCWAMRVTGLDTSARLPWQGDRLEFGATTLTPGDLVLHVDDSSDCGLGVVVDPAVGAGGLIWVETAGSAASLTAAGKRLLALSPAERVAAATGQPVPAATAPAVDLSGVSTDALIRELASRGITIPREAAK